MTIEQPKKMGRPTLFNPQRADAIIASVKRTGFASIAAEINGVHRNTLSAWIERGDNDEEPFAEFAARFHQAKAEWAQGKVDDVKDPAWLLERADPSVFRQQKELQHTGNISLELAALEGMSTTDLKQQIRDVLKEGDSNGTTDDEL